MPEKLSEKDSIALYFVKVVAILSSVAAHVSIIDMSTPVIGFFTFIWELFSCIGVPAFFIVGGILYNRTPGDSGSFWRKRVKSIVIPWLFCGTLIYVYRAIFVGGSLRSLMFWLLGNGTWLYYVTVYLFILALFKLIYKNVPVLWGCVVLTTIQLLLKTNGSGIPSPLGDDYLNPLHWIGFFAMGVLLRRQGLRLSRWFLLGCSLVFVVAAAVTYRMGICYYFHIYNTIFTASAFFVLFAVGRWVAGTRLRNRIREIGTYTYCIYLLHMPIVQPILRRIPGVTFKAMFAPIISIIIMVLLIRFGIWITKKLPFGDKLRMLVGLR